MRFETAKMHKYIFDMFKMNTLPSLIWEWCLIYVFMALANEFENISLDKFHENRGTFIRILRKNPWNPLENSIFRKIKKLFLRIRIMNTRWNFDRNSLNGLWAMRGTQRWSQVLALALLEQSEKMFFFNILEFDIFSY